MASSSLFGIPEIPPDGVQRYKIYSESSADSRLDEDNQSVHSWMWVTKKNNKDDEHTHYKVNLNPDPASFKPIILKPKGTSSNSSVLFDGVVTDVSKSISGVSIADSTSSELDCIHSRLFNNVISELDAVSREDSIDENKMVVLPEVSSLSHVGECLASFHLSEEKLASLHGLGVFYDSGSEVDSCEVVEDSGLWDQISTFVNDFLTVPTEKTLTAFYRFLAQKFNDLLPVLSDPKFQLTVLVVCISVVLTAKALDRRRMRFPRGLRKFFNSRIVDERTFEQIFAEIVKNKR